MISFLHCFNIIKAPKRAYLISGSILIILNDGVFEMDLNNTVLTGKKTWSHLFEQLKAYL